MRTWRLGWLIWLAGTLLVLAEAGGVEAGVTRLVPGQYRTIQAAVNASKPGDTISVAPGTYEEHVCVGISSAISSSCVDSNGVGFRPEGLTITGRGKPSETVVRDFLLYSSPVRLQNLTIRAGSVRPSPDAGVNVAGADVVLYNCLIEGHGTGILGQIGGNITTGKLLIKDNGTGIYLAAGSTKLTVNSSVIVNNLTGIGSVSVGGGDPKEINVRESVIAWNRGNSSYTGYGIYASGTRYDHHTIRLRNTRFLTQDVHLCYSPQVTYNGQTYGDTFVDEGGNNFLDPLRDPSSACQ